MSFGITDYNPTLSSTAFGGSVAFQVIAAEQQELVNQSAVQGLRGLLAALDEAGGYAAAVSAMNEALGTFESAQALAESRRLKEATATAEAAHRDAVLKATFDNILSQIASAREQVNMVFLLAANPVKGIAQNVLTQLDRLKTSVQSRLAGGAFSPTPEDIKAQLAALGQQASALPNDTPKKGDLLQAINGAFNEAKDVEEFQSTTIAKLAGQPQTVHDLGGGYTLSTWGNSGIWTLSDADGKGILVEANGNVTNLNNAKSWKIGSTATFVLPSEVKLTFTPGPPASLEAFSGHSTVSIGNLTSGGASVTSEYDAVDGRARDAELNDGHLISLPANGDGDDWKVGYGATTTAINQGQTIGGTAIQNEIALDPTDVALSPELTAYLNAIGLVPADFDNDGKYNDQEIAQIASTINELVTALQEAFNAALQRIAAASSAMFDLNLFLEELSRQNGNRQDAKDQINAEERALLASIESRLVAAFKDIRRDNAEAPATPPPSGSITGNADDLLKKLSNFTQTGTLPKPVNPPQVAVAPLSGSSSAGTTPPAGAGEDQLGQAMRRAQNLLGGGNNSLQTLLNSLPPATTIAPAPTPPAELAPSDLLNTASAAFQSLPAELAALGLFGAAGADAVGGAQASLLSPESLLTGFNALLASLASFTGQDGLGGEGAQAELTKLLLGGTPPLTQDDLKLVAPTLQAFVNEVSLLGTHVNGGSSLAELQLAKVLAGLAALGSAGAAQSQFISDQAVTGASLGAGGTLNLATAQQAGYNIISMQQGLLTLAATFALLGLNTPSAGQQQQEGTPGTTTPANDFGKLPAVLSQNFYTDPALLTRLRDYASKAEKQFGEHLQRAGQLFTEAQEVVGKFVSLVKQDGLIQQIIKDDGLSDDQQESFDQRMSDLRKDWGVEWGGPPSTPAEASKLNTKVMESGMMV